MAILFPLGFQYKLIDNTWSGVKTLLVNPTEMSVIKKPSIATTRTMGGTVFQPWVNQPDEIEFKGIMYGSRSIFDFRTLQGTVDGMPSMREIKLIYKWKVYPGFIRGMRISANAEKPRMFDYEFVFVSKKAFSLAKMMLGQTTGLTVEVDWVRNQLVGVKNVVQSMMKDPLVGVFGVVAITKAAAGIGNMTNMADEQNSINSDPDWDKPIAFKDGKSVTNLGGIF